MRIHLKKRFTALMLAGMMVTSNVLPAYSATDGIAVEQADASYEAEAAAADASADAENSEVGGASSEQGDAEKPVTDGTDSTTDASANAGAGSDVTDAAAGEQTTANKSEATDGAATEESKSDAANGTATEESKADAANGTATEESKADATNGAETEESKSDAGHGTGAEESKADAVHGSNAGGSSVVGAGSVDIDESTGAAVEIEETKPGELLEEETKLATESEIPKEEDEKKLEEKENRKTIYIAFGKGVKVTATLEDANAVPDDARLRVTEIDDDEMYAAYLEAMDEAEPEIEHTKDNTVLRDISFIMKDENGKEIEYEPTEGSVKITIEYLENHLQDWFGVEDAAEVKTYHLPLAEGVKAEGEKTIDVQNVKASDINVQELDSDVKTEKKVEVEVDSFSMFAMRRAQARTTASTPIELKDITSSIKITTNGDISRDTPFTLNMHFDVDDNRLLDTVKTKNESGESVIRNVWEYDLSEFVASQPLNIINGISGDLYEGNEITGSYKVENNKITFTVKQEFLKDKTQGVNGNFSFEAQLNKKMIGTEKEYTFTFPGSAIGVTVVFPKKAEATKYCESGSGDVTFEKINKDGSITLNYTLKFKANAAVKNLKLTDTLTGPQNYKEDSFKLSANWHPKYAELGDALTFGTDKKSITLDVCKALKIENTTADTEYILEYSTIVKAEDIGNKLINHAQWTWDDNKTTDGGTTSITPHKKLQVRKSVENKNEEYHYMITVGGDGVNMRGHKITDTMSDNQVLDGDITISPDVNGKTTITPVAGDKNYSQNDTKLFEYTFPDDKDYIGTYTIIYKTKPAKPEKPDQLTGIQDIKNRVTDEHNGDHGEASSENQKHNFGVQQMARITKSWAGFNTDAKAVLWNIKVELPKDCTELHNVIVTELVAGCGENQWYRPHSMTFDLSHVAIKKTDGTSYEGSYSIINEGKSIKFENLTSSIVIEGVRTVCSDDHDYTNREKSSFYNQAGVTVGGKSGQNSWAEKTFADWSMSKYVTEDKATGEFTWTVTVNPEKAELREEKNLIFEDEIPQGMELVGGLKITTDGLSSNRKRYDPSWVWPEIAVLNKTGKIHVDITSQLDGTKVNYGGTIHNIETPAGISGVRYTISYKTKLTDEAQKKERENPHQVFSYKNVARVFDQGGNKIKGDATATVEHQYKYFTKTDTSPETLTADIIEYQIVINPEALTLNGGNDLTLTDILPEGTQFISNGYHFTPEGSCKTLGLDSGTRKLTVVVPDSQSITFTYKLKSDNLYPDWSGHVFTNYAELSGTGKQVINVEKKHIIKKHAANITGSTSSIHIHKYDEDNTHTSLSGAEFKLYRLKVSEDGTLTKDGTDSVATATTDKNSGKLTFNNLTPVNNASTAAPYYAYKFVETKAPEGYAINEKYDDKHGCYFVFYEGEDENADKKAQEVKTLIENKNKDKKLEVKVVPGAYTFEVSNKKPSTPDQETIEISGEKVWDDANNQDGLRPDKITVDLYANNQKVDGKTVPVTALSNWEYGWSGLEKLDKDGKEITYTVVETSVPAGYKSSAPGDKNNDYKITNTHTPETTSITVQKVWSDNNDQDGKRPDSLTVKLMKQEEGKTAEEVKEVTLTKDNKWTATVDKLPLNAAGKAITYSWTEAKVPEGYQLTGNETKENVTTLTNTRTPATTSVLVRKTWDDSNDASGKRPSEIKVKLYADHVLEAEQTLTADASGDWSYEFTDLPVYKEGHVGQKINYTVTEEEIPGYVLTDSKSSTEDGKTVIQLTNKSIDFKVNKFERTSTRELDGAKIQIKDSTGAVIAEWVSKSGETHDFGSSLKAGKTYTIHEETAPSGYYTISDVNFTVDAKGQITLAGSSDDVKLKDGVIKICDERIKSSGGGGGGDHPHPTPETTPAETTPAETTVPETTPVETTNPGGGHGGPSEEVETDEYGRVRGANRNKNKNGQNGGNVKGANRGKTRTGDESMMSIFGFGFLAAVLILLGWFGIRFTKRNRR